MFPRKSFLLQKNDGFTGFIVSELLRENQQGIKMHPDPDLD